MGGRDQTRTYCRQESVVFLKTNEPFGGLSNMAGGYPIHVNGVRILTSEALYQVCRFPHLPDVQKLIISQVSPMTAKMRSKPYRKDSRPDWDQVRVRIMRWSLRMKLANNWDTFSVLLLKTGERPIVEESRKDDFWGAKVVDDGDTLVGMNVLGRLLMELREQVKLQGRDAALDVAPPDIPEFLLFGRPIEVAAGAPAQSADEQEQGSLFVADTIVNVESAAVPAVVPSSKSVYGAYRPARMRWLPPVPQHWNEQRAKTFFREVDERSRTGQEELLSVSHLTGVTPRSQKNVTMFKAASYVGSKLCQPGDIVINTLWAWMAALGTSKYAGIVSPAYGVYRPHSADSFNPAYLDYLLRTRAYVAEYIGRSTGIRASRLRLYPNQFLDIALLQPPRPEQDQIVAYLRAQDAHIARFIKAKRDLIALLTEQKLSIIDYAVTRGLDASVKLKSSGIEWLGEVPEHWGISRLKYCVSRIHSGGTPDTGVDGFWADGGEGTPWLMIADVTRSESVSTSTKRLTQAGLASKRLSIVPSGAVLYTIYASIGKAAILGIEAAINQAILGLEPRRDVLSPEFLFFWLRSMERHIKNMASTSTQANLNAAKVKALPIFLPPLDEQQNICGWIKSESLVFDDAIARANEEITLIREYRDRLIADAVTGQVDLRGWQPGPDDVVSDDDFAVLGDDEVEANHDSPLPDEEEADGEEN